MATSSRKPVSPSRRSKGAGLSPEVLRDDALYGLSLGRMPRQGGEGKREERGNAEAQRGE